MKLIQQIIGVINSIFIKIMYINQILRKNNFALVNLIKVYERSLIIL